MEGRFVYGDDVYIDDYYMDEDWEFINGFPSYRISNKGRVYSAKSQKFLKPKYLDNHGHLGFSLSENGRRGYRYLARLVSEAFIPNPNNCPIVRHLDDDPSNNELENLAWGTQKDNMHDCIRNGNSYRITDSDRERGLEKMRIPVKAVHISDNHETMYASQTEASRRLGLRQANVWKVLNGKRKHTCGYRFEYCRGDE